MSKGVQNNHQAEIRISLRAEDGGGEVELKPGLNRLTHEQYRAIKAIPVVANYFKRDVRLLEDAQLPAEEPASEEDTGDGGDGDGEKPLDRMNKAELVAKARELNLAVADEDTKAVLVQKIQAAQAQ
jgi:hypothetical protein